MDPMSIPGAFANPGGGGQQGVFGFDAPPADPAARPTRPALAPAAPAVLDRIKAWARAALPEALVLSEGGPKLELYVRQMACRKPDCVPLETLIILLGDGWHESAEVLAAAKEVTEEQATAAGETLWQSALARAAAATAAAGGDGGEAAAVAPDTADVPVPDADGAGPAPPLPPGTAPPGTIVTTYNTTRVAVDPRTMPMPGADPLTDQSQPGDELKIVLPRDIEDMEEGAEDVYVVGTNGRKVTVIAGLDLAAATLEEVVLRSHLITRMDGLTSLTKLTKLELYDNQIEMLEGLECLPLLTVLDISYNLIRSMAPVAHCPLLEELYLAQNKLSLIEGLDGGAAAAASAAAADADAAAVDADTADAAAPAGGTAADGATSGAGVGSGVGAGVALTKLRKIDLGGNRIRTLAGVGACVGLQELWLGKNKITNMDENLEGLTNLVRLDIQCNRITEITHLETLTNLEELYLSRNGIAKAGGLGMLASLNTVDLSNNRLTSTEGLEVAPALEEVWLSANQIPTFEAVGTLEALPAVSCVYLEHNPVASEVDYRERLKTMLPTLTQIDAIALPRR